jgi:hypothetical protein
MRAVGGHPILVDRHSFLPAQFAFTFHRRALLVPAWLMIAALATARTTHLWLFAALAAATALWLVVKAPEESVPEPATQLRQADSGRFRLQVDRQTKGSYATYEAAEAVGRGIKKHHPSVQVAVYAAWRV